MSPTRRRRRCRSLVRALSRAGVSLVALGVALAVSPAIGQIVVTEAGDGQQPGQKHDGFSVRKEPPKFNDALEDFARYRDKKAWELAFRSLETLAEGKREGMVPAGDGLLVPSRQRMLQSLTSLPPDGKQAFRLFYDAKARQLLERAEAASKAQPADAAQPPPAAAAAAAGEITALREIVDKYFISSVGDRAADRLGDALFEAGDFPAAAAAWGTILTDHPDTALPRLRLSVKRGAALARAGHWALFDAALRDLRGEFAGERLTIGGKDVVATDYLESLRTATLSTATRPATAPAGAYEPSGPVTLPRQEKPAWQVTLLDDALAAKLQAAVSSNNWGSQFSNLRSAIPASVTDGKRLYVNWLGVVVAIDVETGKLLWRTRKFAELGDKFANFVNMGVDTDSYTITLAGDRLFVTGINLDRLGQYQEPIRLVCMSAADGKVRWSSTSGALANWSVVGAPVPAPTGDAVYVAARQRNANDVSLLSVGLDKGDLHWQALLGTAQGGTNYRGETDVPSPVILPTPGTIYVLTNNGALLAVDTATRALNWALTYEPPPVQNRNGGFWSGQAMAQRVKMGASAFADGATLYVKEEDGTAVYAVDTARPALLWKRPMDRENAVMPLADGRLLSVGQELGAIDTRGADRRMTWSAPLPQLVGRINPLVSGDRLIAFAPRGIYEIDLTDGDTVRIFRGADRDSIGGVIRQAPGRLVTVSNLKVTAYPTTATATAAVDDDARRAGGR